MSRGSLYKSAEELRPYIEAKETIMTSPEDAVKHVTSTLYYLSGEGRIHKTATAFGISRQVVSKIVQRVHKAIAVHLGTKYVKLYLLQNRRYIHHIHNGECKLHRE